MRYHNLIDLMTEIFSFSTWLGHHLFCISGWWQSPPRVSPCQPWTSPSQPELSSPRYRYRTSCPWRRAWLSSHCTWSPSSAAVCKNMTFTKNIWAQNVKTWDYSPLLLQWGPRRNRSEPSPSLLSLSTSQKLSPGKISIHRRYERRSVYAWHECLLCWNYLQLNNQGSRKKYIYFSLNSRTTVLK